jgi:hypothetical protein
MAYDKKFRLRVIEYKDAGHTFKKESEALALIPNGITSERNSLRKPALLNTNRPKSATEK